MKEFFAGDGIWLKGNLHTHTTVSDGQYTPQQCIRLYKEHGYNFLCLTDHHICREESMEDGMLILAGVELNYCSLSPRVCYHLTGAGLLHPVEISPTEAPQAMADALHEAGAFVTLAHPAWSLMTNDNISNLHNYDAIEIFNGVSEFYSGRGDSSILLDTMAAGGRLTRITAADDTHFYKLDACSGWLMVKAKACTREDILDALYANRFYSSQGPQLLDLRIDNDGDIKVETSPLARIIFFSDNFYDAKRVQNAPEGGSLTSAVYTPKADDTWVRIEGVDHAGKRVWSNYIDLRK